MSYIKFYIYLILLLVLFAKWAEAFSTYSINNKTNFRNLDTKQEIDQKKGVTEANYEYLVVGGYRPTDINLVKYIVSIRHGYAFVFGSNHICGGSIISEKLILTAAHCFLDERGKTSTLDQYVVVAGTPKRLNLVNSTQVFELKEIIVHEGFHPENLHNDIALIKLKTSIEINDVSTAMLRLPNEKVSSGTEGIVVGWGSILYLGPLPNEALYGNLVIADHSDCRSMPLYTFGMICAHNPNDYSIDVCQGDSGGPLLHNNKVIGISSFGKLCGGKNTYGYYTDVNFFRKWIQENKSNRTAANSYFVILILIIMTVTF